MQPITKLGKVVRMHLLEHGRTIGAFARKTGLSQLTVGKALRQPLAARTGTMLRILAALPPNVRRSAQDALQEELQNALQKEKELQKESK